MGRRSEMDDVEWQTAPADPEILRKKNQPAGQCCFCCMFVTSALVVTACVLVPIEYCRVDADNSVGIDTASGLDTTTGLSFNLTLRIFVSHSHGSKACINPGLYVEVYYHGVQLAASTAEAERLCAKLGKAAEKCVLAIATGVPVGHVMDSLVEDVRNETAVFDVALQIPAGSYGGMGSDYDVKWVSMCEGRRVGGAATVCYSPDQEELYAWTSYDTD